MCIGIYNHIFWFFLHIENYRDLSSGMCIGICVSDIGNFYKSVDCVNHVGRFVFFLIYNVFEAFCDTYNRRLVDFPFCCPEKFNPFSYPLFHHHAAHIVDVDVTDSGDWRHVLSVCCVILFRGMCVGIYNPIKEIFNTFIRNWDCGIGILVVKAGREAVKCIGICIDYFSPVFSLRSI